MQLEVPFPLGVEAPVERFYKEIRTLPDLFCHSIGEERIERVLIFQIIIQAG